MARQSNDGRWRVVATGLRHTEPDHRLAVRLFREKYAPKAELVQIGRKRIGVARSLVVLSRRVGL